MRSSPPERSEIGFRTTHFISRYSAIPWCARVFGYAHIPQRHAARFNTFCVEYLDPLLNFHRPCLFATEVPDPKKPGRIKRVYRPADAMTPLDKLASLPEAARCLRQDITLEHLQQLARALTDVQAAEELNEARAALFRRIPASA
ncbi:hypothetical protein [Thiomonas sp. FB-Cd]|uniref:hypothetical protein n=1 Tax=Thiomonas sp. FB-Cd TaxID=1158292 RepID=UPI00057188FF|nr:hypothetical protein [Thiomonas sp. FB-Cd]